MTKVTVKENINADAQAVWAQLSDFGGIKPGGMIERCDVQGKGVGMVRTLTLSGGGGKVVERLDKHDAKALTFTYAITNDDCPLPVSNYSATVTISKAGSGCTVDWTGTFEPKGDEAAAKKVVEGIYKGGIAGARQATGG